MLSNSENNVENFQNIIELIIVKNKNKYRFSNVTLVFDYCLQVFIQSFAIIRTVNVFIA